MEFNVVMLSYGNVKHGIDSHGTRLAITMGLDGGSIVIQREKSMRFPLEQLDCCLVSTLSILSSTFLNVLCLKHAGAKLGAMEFRWKSTIVNSKFWKKGK